MWHSRPTTPWVIHAIKRPLECKCTEPLQNISKSCSAFFYDCVFYAFICSGRLLIMYAPHYTVLFSYSHKHPFHIRFPFQHFLTCSVNLDCQPKLVSLTFHLLILEQRCTPTSRSLPAPHPPYPFSLAASSLHPPVHIHTWKSQPALGVCEILHSYSS